MICIRNNFLYCVFYLNQHILKVANATKCRNNHNANKLYYFLEYRVKYIQYMKSSDAKACFVFIVMGSWKQEMWLIVK